MSIMSSEDSMNIITLISQTLVKVCRKQRKEIKNDLKYNYGNFISATELIQTSKQMATQLTIQMSDQSFRIRKSVSMII